MRRIIISVFLVLITHSAFAQKEGTKEGSYTAANIEELVLTINSGVNVTVEGVEGANEISYTYHFSGNRQAYKRYFEGFDPSYTIDDGSASLLIEFEKKKGIPVYITRRNELILRVPKNIKFKINTRYSTISVADIDKSVNISNRSGTVRATNIGQGLEVINEYGKIIATDVRGDVQIEGRSANITLRDIDGNAEVSAHYSKMNIGDVDGSLTLVNQSGVINAFNITGSINTQSDYCDHELTNIGGDVDIKAKSGNVSIDGINSLVFSGPYTSLTGRRITGTKGIKIEGKSATINVADVVGNAIITGQHMDIELDKIEGSVSIENKSGKVRAFNIDGNSFSLNAEYVPLVLQGFSGKELHISNRSANTLVQATENIDDITIDSRHGSVNISLPSFNGKVELVSVHGNIKTDYQIIGDLTKLIEMGNRKSLIGKIGTGLSSMSITVDNGDITIKKH